MEVLLKKLDAKTLLDAWKTVFKRHGIARDDAYFAGCFNENETGDRLTLLAFSESVWWDADTYCTSLNTRLSWRLVFQRSMI